jgi:hypothetical protein
VPGESEQSFRTTTNLTPRFQAPVNRAMNMMVRLQVLCLPSEIWALGKAENLKKLGLGEGGVW